MIGGLSCIVRRNLSTFCLKVRKFPRSVRSEGSMFHSFAPVIIKEFSNKFSDLGLDLGKGLITDLIALEFSQYLKSMLTSFGT